MESLFLANEGESAFVYHLSLPKDIYICMRSFKVNEIQAERMMGLIYESVSPKAEQVMNIKQFLDRNFARQELDDINADGYPTKVKTVMMLSPQGQPLKTMQMNEFLSFLDDKYHSLIKDDKDRKNFLKQVISDWYFNKIDKYGLLTTNYIS